MCDSPVPKVFVTDSLLSQGPNKSVLCANINVNMLMMPVFAPQIKSVSVNNMPRYSTLHQNVSLNLSTLSRARGPEKGLLMKLKYLQETKLAPMSRARPGQRGPARFIQKMLSRERSVCHKGSPIAPIVMQGQYTAQSDRGRQAPNADRDICVLNQGPARSNLGHVTTVPVRLDAIATSPPRLLTRKLVGTETMTQPPSPRILHTLRRCLPKWKALQPNAWVLRTIERGYLLQFKRVPRLTRNIIPTNATGNSLVTLRAEILSLLSKGAIRKANTSKTPAGFYSHYFLVPKKRGGGIRPILDLRCLNKCLKRYRFKMLTTRSLLSKVRKDAWFTSVDLKDAFFHIPIHRLHRKFLRFALEGQVYEYCVLPFGMALSPRVFTKVTHAAVAPLRAMGIRLLTYLDDWLIVADTQQEARRHTEMVVSHLTDLGFRLNLEKSELVPTQRTTFLGVQLDSTTMLGRLSDERTEAFLTCLKSIRIGDMVPYRTCQRISGFMASAMDLLRLGRLYARPFTRGMVSLRIPPTETDRLVRVTAPCMQPLRPWLRAGALTAGVSLGLVSNPKVLTTDASLSGWGAILEGRTARGTWNAEFGTKHINFLELTAVLLALKRFEPFVRDCHVLVRTDNITTMAYINRQGGLASRTLDTLAIELTLWCDRHLRSIRAQHLAGHLNLGADLLSRGRYYYGDWSLHPEAARLIFEKYGEPSVDLFATRRNAKCPRFFALADADALGGDAMAQVWPRELLYAFPPLHLIPPLLERIRLEGHSVLLVAPAWGTWRSEVSPLLYAPPWHLPPRRDLVSQAEGSILHPRPVELDLWVWPIRGPPSLPVG